MILRGTISVAVLFVGEVIEYFILGGDETNLILLEVTPKARQALFFWR